MVFLKGSASAGKSRIGLLLASGAFLLILEMGYQVMAAAKQKNKAEIDPEPARRPVSDEAILKVTKEVVVKFIEVGRLTPANFDETFQNIYKTVHNAVRS